MAKMSAAVKAKLRAYKKKGKSRKGKRTSAWSRGFGACGKAAWKAHPGWSKAAVKKRAPASKKCLATLRKRLHIK